MLISQLRSNQSSQQIEAIKQLQAQETEGVAVLVDYFTERRKNSHPMDFIDGKIYQTLLAMHADQLVLSYPQGLIPTPSEKQVDYGLLQELLSHQHYQKADALTTQKLCEAAGTGATARGWLYFSEVDAISPIDLQTIDQLWLIYGEGKFGFSVQRKLWLNLGKNWEKFWRQILWKKEGVFTRYPDEFIWSVEAPRGHLPLSNQIRGNKTLEAMFNHPLWK